MALNTLGLNEAYLRQQNSKGIIGQGGYNINDKNNLSYASGKGWKPTPIGSVAIPNGQIGNYNVTGQFGVTGQPGSGLYGTPKIPTSVNPSSTSPVVSTAPTDPTNTVPFVGMLDPGIQGFQKIVDFTNTPLPSEGKQDPYNKRINDLVGQGYQKPIDYQAELNKYGFQTNVNDLQNLNTQMASVKAQYDKLQEENKNLPIASRIIGGTADRIQRQSAVELGGLSSMAQALQGNITMAQNIADKTIAIKYEPIEKDIANQKYQLDQVYSQLSREDKQKADALKITLDERQRGIEDQKTLEKDISGIMQTAAKNGATSEVLQKIMKSKSIGDATIAAGTFFQTPTERKTVTTPDKNGNKAIDLNNVSGLKDASGNFAKYDTVEESLAATEADIKAKQTGNTRTGLNANSSLAKFNSVWTGETNPGYTGKDLAKYLNSNGYKNITENTNIGSIKSKDLTNAVAHFETGYGTPTQKTQEQQIEEQLTSLVGSDGYVSPEDYGLAKQDWIGLGNTPASFDTKFKGRRNPDNKSYGVEGGINPIDEVKIKEYITAGNTPEEIKAAGYDSTVVDKVANPPKDKPWWKFW